MDREKAIQILKRCEAESYCSHYKQRHCCIGCGQREALDLAIEALSDMSEEEVDYCNNCPYISYSNEGCISRQQAIETCDKMYPQVDRQDIKTVIEATPSVTPTERTGEWAVAYLDHESVGVRPRTLYCSECNWLTSFPSAWCPNCGAKMKGGTENE